MEELIQKFIEMFSAQQKRIVRETMIEVLKDEKRIKSYPERVSVKQASEITGYSKNSLYQMHSQGRVPGAHKVGSKLMFDTATLREWAEKGGAK
ncbi:MAG: helix-turn-helix domain-containing protein [Bacteroidales bacterium]|nr:helix-turn-helix domain-containing protein [Bacteroidales bacterium]